MRKDREPPVAGHPGVFGSRYDYTTSVLDYWAIQDKVTGRLAVGDFPNPLLFAREEWAKNRVGKAGKVVRVRVEVLSRKAGSKT